MTRPFVLQELLDPVVAYLAPQRVILFGSGARGETGPDSDIDLLVLVDDETPADKVTLAAGYEARQSLSACRRRDSDQALHVRTETACGGVARGNGRRGRDRRV